MTWTVLGLVDVECGSLGSEHDMYHLVNIYPAGTSWHGRLVLGMGPNTRWKMDYLLGLKTTYAPFFSWAYVKDTYWTLGDIQNT